MAEKEAVARLLQFPRAMCGFNGFNWILGISFILAFGGLMAASVVLLVRSMDRSGRQKDDHGA
jgi:hypothetical protein